MGGICLNGHKLIIQKSDKIDASSIKKFLSKVRAKHKELHQVHIIWDNAGYHRSKDVQAYAEELNIKIHYLPPYSPNLNPIERLWKIMHEQVSNNRYYEKFVDFSEEILRFFKTIGRKKTSTKSKNF